MSYKEYFKGKKITLMGLGLLGRGVGVAKFLSDNGALLTVTDLKSEAELENSLAVIRDLPNITYVLGMHRLEDFENKDMIIKTAGVPTDSPFIAHARKHGVPVEMDASLFLKIARDVIPVGITGTRGKTTITTLVYEILKGAGHRAHLAGNIRGVATLPLLSKIKPGDFVVLELDSWQLQGFGESKMSPHVSIFGTFMADHMNYYKGDMNKYWDDKANIFKFQKNTDTLVVGDMVQHEIYRRGERVLANLLIAHSTDIPKGWKPKLLGEHNRLNIVCAMHATRALGVSDAVIKKVVESFSGVPGRLEFVREVRGIKFFNDTTATTPEATIADLRALKERYPKAEIILIGGGADKELMYDEYAQEVPKLIKTLVLFEGKASDKIKDKFPWEDVPLYSGITSMDEAFKAAIEEAREGNIVLLSPAAASFGVFKNEYDRGDQFVKLANTYRP